MKRFTDKTIGDFDALIEELRHVRRNGYAMDREEFQPGVVCVGAAIRDHAGAGCRGHQRIGSGDARDRRAPRRDAAGSDCCRHIALSADLGEPGSLKPLATNTTKMS